MLCQHLVSAFGAQKWMQLIYLVVQTVKSLPSMQETWVQSLGQKIPWRWKWLPTPVFLPGESCGQRSLVGCSPWNCIEVDTIERLAHTHNIPKNWSLQWIHTKQHETIIWKRNHNRKKKKPWRSSYSCYDFSPHHYQKRGHLIQIKLTGLIKLSHYRQSQFLQYSVSPKGTGTTCDFRKRWGWRREEGDISCKAFYKKDRNTLNNALWPQAYSVYYAKGCSEEWHFEVTQSKGETLPVALNCC